MSITLKDYAAPYSLILETTLKTNTNNDILTLEENNKGNVLSRVAKIAKAKMEKSIAEKMEKTKNYAKDQIREKSSDLAVKVAKNPFVTAGVGAAGLTGAKIVSALNSDDGENEEKAPESTSTENTENKEIKESEYSQELYSDKPENSDPSKEDNNSISDLTHKSDSFDGKGEKPKDSGIEYAMDSQLKEEGLTGNPKSENAIKEEEIKESSFCCGNCEKEGHNDSDSCCSKEISESTTSIDVPKVEFNPYSFISKII